jgi:hypothetical protein
MTRSLHVVVALGALVVACGGGDGTPAAADCSEVLSPPVQGGEHVIGDREPPVPYNATPPTSGWHSSGAFEIAIQPPDDPLPEVKQVSVLEAGGVVVTYNELAETERSVLEQHVRDQYAGRVAVTSYDKLGPGEVAFTAQGKLQRCDALDLAALDAFVAAYADEDPRVPGEQ